jgi:hypothetical protein
MTMTVAEAFKALGYPAPNSTTAGSSVDPTDWAVRVASGVSEIVRASEDDQ